MKSLQYFSTEYIQSCQGMTADQILQFLEEFRLLHGPALLEERLAANERLRKGFLDAVGEPKPGI